MLVAAANLKLLILGPLLAGLLALGIGYALPQSFTSQAHLNLGESGTAVEAMMRSPAVLDVVLAQFPSPLGLTDCGRRELSKKFRLNSGSSRQKAGATLTKLETVSQLLKRISGESPKLIWPNV